MWSSYLVSIMMVDFFTLSFLGAVDIFMCFECTEMMYQIMLVEEPIFSSMRQTLTWCLMLDKIKSLHISRVVAVVDRPLQGIELLSQKLNFIFWKYRSQHTTTMRSRISFSFFPSFVLCLIPSLPSFIVR